MLSGRRTKGMRLSPLGSAAGTRAAAPGAAAITLSRCSIVPEPSAAVEAHQEPQVPVKELVHGAHGGELKARPALIDRDSDAAKVRPGVIAATPGAALVPAAEPKGESRIPFVLQPDNIAKALGDSMLRFQQILILF